MSHAVEPAVPSAKQTLRRQLRAQRHSVARQRNRDADADAIATAVSALLGSLANDLAPSESAAGERPAYSGPLCVAIYRSLPTEPPTAALTEKLHARGATLIVPEMLADRDLDWRELRSDGSEGPALGLKAITDALVILTPALAVDHQGTRLGQGGGSYDRALARRRSDALLVAIVNDEEYVQWRLPSEAHDVPMDAVITPGAGFQTFPPKR